MRAFELAGGLFRHIQCSQKGTIHRRQAAAHQFIDKVIDHGQRAATVFVFGEYLLGGEHLQAVGYIVGYRVRHDTNAEFRRYLGQHFGYGTDGFFQMAQGIAHAAGHIHYHNQLQPPGTG